MKKKLSKKMLLASMVGLGLISSIALPLTMTSCGSNKGSSNGSSSQEKPSQPVEETITLNIEPSEEIFRKGDPNDTTIILNREGKKLSYNDSNNSAYLENRPINSNRYDEYSYPVNEYFRKFMLAFGGLYNHEITQKLFNPDKEDNAVRYVHNNVDLAANIMMKHIMNDDLIWLFFNITQEDWLKIKDKVDLVFDFERIDKVVNGELTISAKPDSNLILNGTLTSTFSFNLHTDGSYGVETNAPLYVDINSAIEQTAENVVMQLTKYLENNLFMSRSKAWDYVNNEYPTIDDYKNIKKPGTSWTDGTRVSYSQKNGYGLQTKPDWFNQNNEYATYNTFRIENLSLENVAKLVGFISGTDILNSFNYKLNLTSSFRDFKLGLFTGTSNFYNSGTKEESFCFAESGEFIDLSNFSNIRLIDTNKQIGFSGILKMLPHNSIYIEQDKEASNSFGEKFILADIGKMFEDGLFEQYRKN